MDIRGCWIDRVYGWKSSLLSVCNNKTMIGLLAFHSEVISTKGQGKAVSKQISKAGIRGSRFNPGGNKKRPWKSLILSAEKHVRQQHISQWRDMDLE